MSQDETQPKTRAPQDDDIPPEQVDSAEPAGEDDPASTIGTGTSLALGCIAGTILLIIIGLIYLGIVALL